MGLAPLEWTGLSKVCNGHPTVIKWTGLSKDCLGHKAMPVPYQKLCLSDGQVLAFLSCRVDWAIEGLQRTPNSDQVDWAIKGLQRTPNSDQAI